jgi:tryptophan halogenase
MESKKIVVLGGGTAGWMTALFCRKTFPLASISVIENTSIGTVGVGEGTTLGFIHYLQEMELDEFHVMREAGGVVKTGTSFENWNGDNKKYFHGFRGIDTFSMPPHYQHSNIGNNPAGEHYLKALIKEGLDFNEYTYPAVLAYHNKFDLFNAPVSMHFDTAKLGKYFRGVGEQRHIVHVDGNFSHVEVDGDGFIKTLYLDSGSSFDCDFVFDCSGFARLLIGNFYKADWVSYKDFLPMKKAIAFTLESETDIKSYTQAISMKYGWMWKIPVKDRIGAGYVFDSDYVTDEEAIDEIQQTLNQSISNVRSIPFNAGRHEQVWIKNCMAVGLASSFLEPLEATSLSIVALQLKSLKQCLNHVFTYNANTTARYNKKISDGVDGVAQFIYLHYLTKRSDTEFWKTFEQRYPPPQKIGELLELIYENNLRAADVHTEWFFTIMDYLDVCNGLNMFKQPVNIDGYENLTPSVEVYKKIIDVQSVDRRIITTHMEFLERVYGPEQLGLKQEWVCTNPNCEENDSESPYQTAVQRNTELFI